MKSYRNPAACQLFVSQDMSSISLCVYCLQHCCVYGVYRCPHTLQEVKEKKRWGRLQKSKGDWSLLVGAPKDAFEHYKSAMELSRAAGDAIW